MARETLSHARVACEGPSPTERQRAGACPPRGKNTSCYRSAGACPPRSLHGAGNPLACACGMRGPAPYGEDNAQGCLREARTPHVTVARGPVPRDRCIARGTLSHARVACEGPRPTMMTTMAVPREASTPHATVARGPVPRERCLARDRPALRECGLARDRPAPYGETTRKAVPRERWHGAGQARALR